jgi:hypothetical protein
MAFQDNLKTNMSVKIVIAVAVFSLLGASGYFYNQYRMAQQRLNNPQQAVLDDVRALTKTVGKLMLLPNEDPTVATVADVDKLKNQRFFTSAVNGDKVLIFNNAKKAILYRPSINKIIEIMPINIDVTPTPVAAVTAPVVVRLSPTVIPPTPTPFVYKFVLRNGTTVTGLAKRYESELKSKIATATVVASDNAKRRDYTKTTIVGISASGQAAAADVSTRLGISAGTLPAGEDVPANTDFLIIIGSDKSGGSTP